MMRADERADRPAQAADHRDDQNVDHRPDAGGAGRNLAAVPDQQHAGEGGDQRRECVGRDAVRGDVEAERRHAPRIVADALQRQPERRARDVDDHEIGERPRRTGSDSRTAPAGASRRRTTCGVRTALKPREAVEDRVVLQREVIERRRDRERDHDRVDALGAHRERRRRAFRRSPRSGSRAARRPTTASPG